MIIQFQKIVRVSSKYKYGAIGYASNVATKRCKHKYWCTECKYKQPSRSKCYEPYVEAVKSKPIELLTDKTFRVNDQGL